MELFPVGQRPKCRYCNKELRPRFRTIPVPFELWSDEKKKSEFKAANPKQFTGHYGSYSDNLFCGLSCGYMWAANNAMGSIF